MKEPIEIVDNKKKYTEKAMASIKELIQTEKNYIENLKAIQSYFNYFEKSKADASPNETDKRKFSISDAIRKMPERLRSGRYKICMGNFKALLNFHERYLFCSK